MRKLFIFICVTLSHLALAHEIVLIPGAASAAGELSLVNGLSSRVLRDHSPQYFYYIQKQLQEDGHKVDICPRLYDNDQSSLEERALDCREFLKQKSACSAQGDGVILIAHSLGGLVGRKVLLDEELFKCVKALVTIATPHQGTPAVDALMREDEYHLLRTSARAAGFTLDRPRYVRQLQWGNIDYADEHNQPKIFSISNESQHFGNIPFLKWTGAVVARELLELGVSDTRHDGLIPTVSMIYGQHLAHIEANHLEVACVLHGQHSKGCKKVLSVLREFLK
jgi:pimeloyl-ACP methyl ester carboxylesterase